MGIYYDGNINMNQFNDIQAGAAPFSLRYDAVNDTSQALPQRLVSNEYPAGLLGAPPQPNANPPAAFRFAQSYYPIPAVYQWSFSVQQKLASSWVVEGDYVGSHTIHQFQFVDDNAPALPRAHWPMWRYKTGGPIRSGAFWEPGLRLAGRATTPALSASRTTSGTA